MAVNRDWLKEDKKVIDREKRQLRDAKEVLGFLLVLYEKAAKPRMQYKRVRSALQMAIRAIEKQTPKRVVNNHCPECGRLVAFRHCERCGQCLYW